VITRATFIAIAASCLLLGCKGDDDGADGQGQDECLMTLPDCSDAKLPFPATFDNIYAHVLILSCGSSSTGSSCHSSDGAQHGLVLQDPEVAYDHLLGMAEDDRARVIPKDPRCSILMERLESKDSTYRMPVGGELSIGERCAIREWIEQGATRK
jgi:hypothetical protein